MKTERQEYITYRLLKAFLDLKSGRTSKIVAARMYVRRVKKLHGPSVLIKMAKAYRPLMDAILDVMEIVEELQEYRRHMRCRDKRKIRYV